MVQRQGLFQKKWVENKEKIKEQKEEKLQENITFMPNAGKAKTPREKSDPESFVVR